MVMFMLTAYIGCSVIDALKYRDDSNLFTINIDGHRLFYVKCTGTGYATIMMENSLGGTAVMYWHFLPRFMSTKYKVCVHDWRVYGWSDTLEHDYMDALKTESVSQLPYSYYFTTRILVLKFTNKGVFFEEIQDSHFPRKRGYFGTHLHEFREKGVNFDVQCFTVKLGLHLD